MSRIKQSGVYQITNLINGKSYIGSSKDIANRWYQHKAVFKRDRPITRSILFDAWKKYGEASFIFQIIEECEPVKDVLLSREQHYIDTLNPQYNLMPIAGSRLGSKSSPETIEKIRQKNLGRKNTEDTKRLMSESAKQVDHHWLTGADFSEERRTRIADKLTGNQHTKGQTRSEATRQRMSEAQRAISHDHLFVPCSDEKARKISEAQKGKPRDYARVPCSDEKKVKIAAAHKGMKRSEEAKANMRAARLRYLEAQNQPPV